MAAISTEELDLVFDAGKHDFTVAIPGPKEGLTAEEIKAAAPKIAKVMVTRSGVAVGNLKKAIRKTESQNEIDLSAS